ncbi:MgtC/SapB family protein [Paenibacillus aceris]|uniref:Mg2+ transporter-C (MgtC) family protein n=1 Tax=Paenibacillus aceris TaxID=869555 RepID=A0ABS4I105_9BACL|nr:MgtC/SapB family protein [Paenibacillus aceris]MBP1964400.1 putative Mg2+ transporter-C (MgtC) family protein [Paenibacillus aceris]NHW35885.1 MgtC/SapB family protein [Paenibacillus aceris]
MTGTAGIWTISHGELLLRLVLAVFMGGAVGIEREWHNHAAGFRTHILVCLGSTTIMLLSIYGFSEFANEPNVRLDPARLAAQVISGIGFIGAGAILRNGSTISGLTTAASIWVVAGIGLCVGAGFLYAAVFSTMLLLISLFVLNKWEKYVMRHRRNHEMTIKTLDNPTALGQIATALSNEGIQIVNVKMMRKDAAASSGEAATIQLQFVLHVQNPVKLMEAMEKVHTLDFVIWTESGGKSLDVTHQGVRQVH